MDVERASIVSLKSRAGKTTRRRTIAPFALANSRKKRSFLSPDFPFRAGRSTPKVFENKKEESDNHDGLNFISFSKQKEKGREGSCGRLGSRR